MKTIINNRLINKKINNKVKIIMSSTLEDEILDWSEIEKLTEEDIRDSDKDVLDKVDIDTKVKSKPKVKSKAKPKVKAKIKLPEINSDILEEEYENIDENFLFNEEDIGYEDEKIVKNSVNSLKNKAKIHKEQKKTVKNKELLKKQAEKFRIKSKVMNAIKVYTKLNEEKIPNYLLKMIKNKRFNFNKISRADSIECYDFFKKHSKEELTLCLFVAAKDTEELEFVKDILMKEDFFKILFTNIILI